MYQLIREHSDHRDLKGVISKNSHSQQYKVNEETVEVNAGAQRCTVLNTPPVGLQRGPRSSSRCIPGVGRGLAAGLPRLALQIGLLEVPSSQGQAGWGCEQPGVEGGVPAYSRGLERDDLRGPFQPKPFYDNPLINHVLQRWQLRLSFQHTLSQMLLLALRQTH